MRHALVASVLLWSLASVPAIPGGAADAGRASAQAPPALRAPLTPFAFLVGHCWTGSFPDGKSSDTHCFESVFDGQFVRDRHRVEGAKAPYAGETLYAWDAKRNVVAYTYWASDGGVSTGQMLPGTDGEMVFPESYANDGQEVTMKSVWTRRADDSYEVVVSRQVGGAWKELWRMTMRRQ